ncbi:MAG: hypothetical protein EAZ07_06335 [Cytophagales bacterium]|nr:MAG: hypothetical protein EAZ07_06335 [Cytophagales bacterium]
MKLLYAFALFILLSYESIAQTNRLINKKVDNFSYLDLKTNTNKTLNEFQTSKGVVIIFFSITCPFAKKYESRLAQLINEYYSNGITFLMLDSPNKNEGESAKEILEYSNQKTLNKANFGVDIERKIINQLGVTKVPEVFVLKKINTNFVLLYAGAIDNSPNNTNEASENYLELAIKALINNTSLKIDSKKASGCNIEDY